MKMTGEAFFLAVSVLLFILSGAQPGWSGPVEKTVSIPAKPEPIKIDPSRTAAVVVDMQNGFVSKGGMVNLVGHESLATKEVIANIKKTLDETPRKFCACYLYR